MMSRSLLSHKAIALLIVFSLMQLCVNLALAGPDPAGEKTVASSPPSQPQANGGRLITHHNQTATVNGNVVGNGATVLPGATVETGNNVAVTINLGPLGSIEIAPNTKVRIEFSNGQIKLTIIEGCAIVRNRDGVSTQVFTDKGQVAGNNGTQPAVTDVCYPPGAPNAIVNQGAAANAGAGGGGAGAGGGGVKTLTLLGILGGGGTALALIAANRGSNPSPAQP